ncbi:hypothetical protein CEXT_767621 [Caerostris extrusa]|uniref:Uncharacterized protein n=1 Tax=Caerostris extrusa TaxID=172846 RepID=A0AAV4UD29_CAEEX|nr:hypothetical protein CEXT_767621 [Caerostris extrusa]
MFVFREDRSLNPLVFEGAVIAPPDFHSWKSDREATYKSFGHLPPPGADQFTKGKSLYAPWDDREDSGLREHEIRETNKDNRS